MHKIFRKNKIGDQEFNDISYIVIEYILDYLNLHNNIFNVHILDDCICNNIMLTSEMIDCMQSEYEDMEEWIKCEDKRDDCVFSEVFGQMSGFMDLLNKVRK